MPVAILCNDLDASSNLDFSEKHQAKNTGECLNSDELFMAADNHCQEHAIPQSLGGWRWFALYGTLAMVIQWPLVGSLTTHISYGQEQEITVPLLNVWTVWWNADRAANGFRGYWDSPIFFPTRKTFVFSESQPTSLIVAPIIWLTQNRGLAYNVYQLLIIALNGYSAHRLLRRLGHVPWMAICGGVMSQILPFVMWQFGAVQLTTLFGIQWTLHAVVDLFDPERNAIFQTRPVNNTISDLVTAKPARYQFTDLLGVRLGLAYGMTYWLCNYWGLFLTLLLVPCSVCLWNRRLFEFSFWRNVAIAVSIAIVMIGPIAWTQRSLANEHHWQAARTDDLVHDLSAHWRDHTDLPWYSWAPWLEFPERDRDNAWALGGGGFKLILIPIGLFAALLLSHRRRWGIFVMAFGALAFGLSLGPTIRIIDRIPLFGGSCPYALLQQYVPGFSLIRSPFRFAAFVQLAAVWLSVEAIDLLNPQRWLVYQLTPDESRRWKLPSFLNPLFGLNREPASFYPIFIPFVLIGTLITLEAVPPKMRIYPLPSTDGLPIWVVWLRDRTDPKSGVACLPFPRGYQVKDYEETTLWMYWSTFHRRPLLNGYSGFFPDSYNQVKDELELFQRNKNPEGDEPFEPHFSDYAPDNPGLKRLNESGVRYVVMQRWFGNRDDVWTNPQTRSRWKLMLSDDVDQIDIYELAVTDK